MNYTKEAIKELYKIYIKAKEVYESEEDDSQYEFRLGSVYFTVDDYNEYMYDGEDFMHLIFDPYYNRIKQEIIFKFHVKSSGVISCKYHDSRQSIVYYLILDND